MTIDPQKYAADMAELKLLRGLVSDKDLGSVIRMVRDAAIADYKPRPITQDSPEFDRQRFDPSRRGF